MEIHRGQWILGYRGSTTRVIIFRWIARLWGLLLFVFALIRVFTPDPNASGTIAFRDGFMLSLWGVAFIGLILAWRWERLGALITLLIMPIREVLFVIIYREWTVNFLLIWALFVPPAVLFLIAWRMDRKTQGDLSDS